MLLVDQHKTHPELSAATIVKLQDVALDVGGGGRLPSYSNGVVFCAALLRDDARGARSCENLNKMSYLGIKRYKISQMHLKFSYITSSLSNGCFPCKLKHIKH